ncbi:MAG: hydrolase, TatD family [Rickettsiales bacterium]|jgi:TatD DNase family protein|nr:hydrolase, TatD family [Rickettsiales bacterium]
MTLPLLVDSHCHLDYPQFQTDPDSFIARAMENGVGLMQTISTKITEFPQVLAVAERYKQVYCSVGIHPHEVEHQPKITLEDLLKETKHPKVIGIGETGLDYYYEHSPRALQQESFRIHIAAARETGLPLIVHTRDADQDTLDILEEEMVKGAFPGLIHCFSSSEALAWKAIELGLYISVSGIVTFKKAEALQEIIRKLPLEKLLVETDAPYLAPVPKRGQTNEPSYTRYTAEFLANLKSVSFEEVAKTTTRNFFSLFTKAPSSLT